MTTRGAIRDGSQESLILAHLQTGAEISPLQALELFGCLRLGARIFNLRREGVSITARTIRSGRKAWAAYRLAIPTG